MEKNKKRSKFLIIFVTLMYLAVYWFSGHTINWKYNDRKILGHHIEEVRERYGEFNSTNGDTEYYYFLYKKNEGLLGSFWNYNTDQYYIMKINEDGVVEKIDKGGRMQDT